MSKADLLSISGRRWRWLVLLLVASLPLVGWWTYGLFDLDEGFYAAVTGSMIRHNEWITPLLNGHPWFEKPILLYWLAKPAVAAFGQDFGPRLPSILANVATYAVVAWFLRRRVGAMAAVMGLFILGSSLLIVALGRMMMTDALLLLFFSAAMLAYYESIVGNSRWKIVTAACLGVAVLAKGPVALILFALIAFISLFFVRSSTAEQRKAVDEVLTWLIGIFVLALVIASWYVPAYLANGHVFVEKFLIEQNIQRFRGGDEAHTLDFTFWVYIPILLVGMFPWILWLPNAIANRARFQDASSTLAGDPNLRSFCVIWASVVFIFFSISGAKLIHYVLPACTPIAILIAMHLGEKWKGLSRETMRPRLLWTLVWLCGCWMLAQLGLETYYITSGQKEAHDMARWINSQSDKSHPVAVYQLPRRSKEKGTGKLKIQETSLPSLSLYLDRDLLEPKQLTELGASSKPIWVFTRVDRISLDDVDQFDRSGNSILLLPQKKGAYFEVFQLVKTSNSP